MDNKNDNQLKIEVSSEVAAGHYSNLAMLAHTPGEFFIDFINVGPNMPQAKVLSRIIMSPENAKNLMFALQDNIRKYEQVFGEIQRKVPVNNGNNSGETPNPFMA